MNEEILILVKTLFRVLGERKLTLTTAESCTGGLLAATITTVAGSSAYFDRGFIVYSNISKVEELDVSPKTIEIFGAVSNETAAAMAQGALAHSYASISIAITGIAGPEGATPRKPLGTVSFAVAYADGIKSITRHFSGNREQIRKRTVKFALELLLDIVKNIPNES